MIKRDDLQLARVRFNTIIERQNVLTEITQKASGYDFSHHLAAALEREKRKVDEQLDLQRVIVRQFETALERFELRFCDKGSLEFEFYPTLQAAKAAINGWQDRWPHLNLSDEDSHIYIVDMEGDIDRDWTWDERTSIWNTN